MLFPVRGGANVAVGAVDDDGIADVFPLFVVTWLGGVNSDVAVDGARDNKAETVLDIFTGLNM